MKTVKMHREDIKAKLRKLHGSTSAFEKKRNLPSRSVKDVLYGRKSARTLEAIAKELGCENLIVLPIKKPRVAVNSKVNRSPNGDCHCLNAGAK